MPSGTPADREPHVYVVSYATLRREHKHSRTTGVVHKAYHQLAAAVDEAQRLWSLGLEERYGHPKVVDRRDDEQVPALVYELFNQEGETTWPTGPESKEQQIWVMRVPLA